MGCGWLGLPLAKSLIQKGYRVKGSTTSQDKLSTLSEAGVVPFIIRLTENGIDGDIQKFLESDLLIVNIPPKRIPDIAEIYPQQLDNLLKNVERSAVKKVLFISTSSVYQNTNGKVDETTDPQPEKPGGKVTLAAEKKFTESGAFKTTIVRLAGLIGPKRDPGRFLAGKSNIAGANIPVNLIHLDDCLGIIENIITRNAWRKIFNGCSPDHPLKKDFYTQAAKKAGLIPPSFNDQKSDFKIVDGSKVTWELGYQYKYQNLMEMD